MTELIQPSELQTLILALALTPVMVWAYRGIDLPHRRWLAFAIAAMMGAYVATVAEGFVANKFLNDVEHLLYALAGCFFLITSISLLKWRLWLAQGERDR